jgi:hypothetical protein
MSRTFLTIRRAGLLAGIAVGVLSLAPIGEGMVAPAQAQVAVSIEFQDALAPFGVWRHHPRWGAVWIPAARFRGWRPYQVGHWVYTEEWGWYWISDEDEADWGWIAYHYGRWLFEPGYGWFWIPGDEWAPAWVDWRRGNDFVGWAPLPPEEVIYEVREAPQYWLFVRPYDLIAPRLRPVLLPPQRAPMYFQRTVVVNRTFFVDHRGPRIAVNPGISPAYIAAAAHRPLPTFQVQPRVLAGTRGVPGAIEIRGTDLPRGPSRGGRAPSAAFQPGLQPLTAVQPATSVPPPRPLGRDEHGRLGTTPPRAAQGATGPIAPPPPPAGQTPQQPPRPGMRGPTPPSGPAPATAPSSPPPAGATAPSGPPPAGAVQGQQPPAPPPGAIRPTPPAPSPTRPTPPPPPAAQPAPPPPATLGRPTPPPPPAAQPAPPPPPAARPAPPPPPAPHPAPPPPPAARPAPPPPPAARPAPPPPPPAHPAPAARPGTPPAGAAKPPQPGEQPAGATR